MNVGADIIRPLFLQAESESVGALHEAPADSLRGETVALHPLAPLLGELSSAARLRGIFTPSPPLRGTSPKGRGKWRGG